MRAIPVLFLFLPVALPLVAQRDPCRDQWGDDDRARVCDVRLLGAGGLHALRIDPGVNGGAEVEAWDRDSIAVEVRVPSDYNAKFETGTRNGPFHTDIPITVQGNIGRLGQQISTTPNGPLTIRSGR